MLPPRVGNFPQSSAFAKFKVGPVVHMLNSTAELAHLVSRVAQGDRDAFAKVYGATSAKLYGIVLRILVRRDLTDEVLQEVFVKIWQRAAEFDPERASPITWMATIARNRALDEVRRKQPIALDDAPAAFEVADPGMLASEKIVLSEANLRLERCLGRLEPDKQMIVRLAYLDGWSREQIAERFGAPIPTVKTWLHRSLKQLKDCLDS